MRPVALSALLAVTVAVWASAASAAAPRIVIVSGAPLARQVAISDWQRIFVIVGELQSAATAPRAQLRARPRLHLALFWGPAWNDYLKQGKSADALRPAQADQAGTFYPATGGHPALIDLPWVGSWPRVVPAKALRALAGEGVPTHVK
jgi:hypothetical protein